MLCHLLPHLVADGPAQMALDQAILDSVSEDPSAAVLRTYEWSEPTLSLGYFQRIAEAEAEPRWSDVPRVRRPTGGGAIWHDRELTYALILPRAHPAAARASDLYRTVHGAIAATLRGRGVAASRRGRSVDNRGERPFLCFTDRDPEDIVVAEFKVVGSAQRRRPGAVLQHGSVLLSRSARTPELPGIGDLTDVSTDVSSWSESLTGRILETLGLLTGTRDLSGDERRRAVDLERDVFRRPDWTRRR